MGTPPEAAAEMLYLALSRGDLEGRRIIDLGTGTGPLAIGAALLGAASVVGIDADGAALGVARENGQAVGVEVDWVEQDVASYTGRADTVLMNPPFGAQRKGADRPFWTAARAAAVSAIYSFALASSRTFIAERAVGALARIEETRPVPWTLPRTFPHHRKDRVKLAVDLWVIRIEPTP